jgi:hypothetical protein
MLILREASLADETFDLVLYIYYLAKLERESSQIKVKNILDNCLLFSCSKLIATIAYSRPIANSVVLTS